MINLAKNLLLVYLLLKPFYLFNSGGLQIADGFLLLAFVLFFLTAWLTRKGRNELGHLLSQHKLFVIFVVLTFVVNGLYFIVYPEFKFILSSLYFIFNLFAIIVFAAFLKDKVFLSRVGSVFKFNLMLQLGLWAAQIGRFYGPERYMGTFNDPNQFGYYILLSFLFIYVIDILLEKKRTYIFYILAIFMIIQSGSTGMLLGMAVFSVLFAAFYLKKQLTLPYRLIRRVMHSIGVIIVLAIPLTIMALTSRDEIKNAVVIFEANPIFLRVDEKAEKATGDANISIFQDRNLDQITKYPYLVLWGAGEGAFDRFEKAAHPGKEIHSTFPAIAFYYGIVPFLIISIWMWKQVKNLTWKLSIANISLLVVSFILLNQRQALFWVFIVLASMTHYYIDFKNSHKAVS